LYISLSFSSDRTAPPSSSRPSHNYPSILLPTNPTISTTIKMQFSTVVLALAATASAAVLPRDNAQGSWLATLTLGPVIESLYLTAEFTSDEYPGLDKYTKLRNACVYAPNAKPLPAPKRCDHVEFDYSYDGAGKFCLVKTGLGD
jgi:hypothetical protein